MKKNSIFPTSQIFAVNLFLLTNYTAAAASRAALDNSTDPVDFHRGPRKKTPHHTLNPFNIRHPNVNDSCPVVTEVKCGETYNGPIALGQDIICEEDPDYDTLYNSAITLDGPGAVLDCQGWTVTQKVEVENATSTFGTLVDCAEPYNTPEYKTRCGFFWWTGITFRNGATVTNCGVQSFHYGVEIGSGDGLISNSDISLNTFGVRNYRYGRNGVGTMTIQNTKIHDNMVGLEDFIGLFDSGYSGANYEEGNKVVLEDVEVTKNTDNGIELYGSSVHFKNVVSSGNGGFGISYYVIAEGAKVDFRLEGKVFVKNNGSRFLQLDPTWSGDSGIEIEANPPTNGEVHIRGNVITDLNAGSGFKLGQNVTVSVVEKGGGSLMSCKNNAISSGYDIENEGDSVFQGNDYICKTKGGGDHDLPHCKSCPLCSISSKSSSKSGKYAKRP